jgi:acyl-CoA-dependent ceramide synthase
MSLAVEEKALANEPRSKGGVSRSPQRPKRRNEDESLLASLCTLICNNQLGISVNLVLLILLTHIFFPRARRRTSKFLRLSYHNPEHDLYGCGTDDLAFVTFAMIVLTGLRVAVMEYILDPLARVAGIRTRKGMTRFKEQAWLIMYCTFSWSLGMYIVYHSEFWLNLHGLWQGWPFREVNGLNKWYYLVQWAFYAQQILVVNIEEKRKDYAEMFTHHIFTVALIFLSYGYYHMRVGTLILTIMDLVDILLPTAKMLRYLGFTTLCDIAFGVFVIAWFITRHIFYPMVSWSVYAHAPTDMAPGCYFADGSMVPMNSTEFDALGGNRIWANLVKSYTDRMGPICWNPTMRYCFLTLLLALQVIVFFWFAMIVKVVYKVLSGQSADDVRSDDEGEDDEIENEIAHTSHPINALSACHGGAPLEQEVGVESLNLTRKSYKKHSNRSSGSRTSGISIPGHGDRKELLGRIGCDKPT